MESQLKISPYQKSKLRSLLEHVLKNNQFYQKKYSNIIKRNVGAKAINLFTKLPLLSKKELIDDQRTYPPFGKNHDKNSPNYYLETTSGTSTNNPLFIPTSKRDYTSQCQQNKEAWISQSLKKGDVILLSTAPNLYGTLIESASQLGAIAIPIPLYSANQTLRVIIDAKVTAIFSTPTVISSLITTLKQNGSDKDKLTPHLKKILLGGETMSINTKKYIENSLSVKCYSRFGLTECGAIAVNCRTAKDKTVYHHLPDSSVLEIFSIIGEKHANEGELVLTNLWRKDYPFIRYRTGNRVRLIHKKCKCGLKGQLFESLGRCDNTVRFYTKYIYPDECEMVLQNNKRILDYQIELSEENSIEIMAIRIKTNATNIETITLNIMDEFEKRFGLHPKVLFVPIINRTASQWKSKKFIDLRRSVFTSTENQEGKISVLSYLTNKLRSFRFI